MSENSAHELSENSAHELSENSAFIFWSCLNCLKTVNKNFLNIMTILTIQIFLTILNSVTIFYFLIILTIRIFCQKIHTI